MDDPNLQCVPRPHELLLRCRSSEGERPAAAEPITQGGVHRRVLCAVAWVLRCASRACAAAWIAGLLEGGAYTSLELHTHACPPDLALPRRRLDANVRAALVAGPGCVLLGADYRQMEARLMAHFRWGWGRVLEGRGWKGRGSGRRRCLLRGAGAASLRDPRLCKPSPSRPACLPAVQPRPGTAAAAGGGRCRRA